MSDAKSPTTKMIPWASPVFWGKEREYVLEALDSTWISGGPFVERLESQIAEYCKMRFAVAVANGTAALHAAYLALNIQPGDEIVVPGFCFQAAANMALHLCAKPVFCEIDPETWCMRAQDVEKCLTPRTKLIVAVHPYGNLCPMAPLMALAEARGVAIIEDAAESFASTYRGKPAGAIAPLGTFSFQATKTITTGEGGMVVTSDPAIDERLRLYRSHGMLGKRYWHTVPGHNFRLTNLQAALGCAQMDELHRIVAARKNVHGFYRQHLEKLDGLAMQRFEPDVDPVLWAMAVRLDAKAYPQGRDAVMEQLRAENIETRNGFFAASMLPLYSGCGPLPVCEEVSRQVISLPTFPTLTKEEVAVVCGALRRLRR